MEKGEQNEQARVRNRSVTITAKKCVKNQLEVLSQVTWNMERIFLKLQLSPLEYFPEYIGTFQDMLLKFRKSVLY